MHLLAIRGDRDGSDREITVMEGMSRAHTVAAWCSIYRSFNMRGRGRLDDAAKLLDRVSTAFPRAGKLIQLYGGIDLLDTVAEQIGTAEGIILIGCENISRETEIRVLLARYGAE